MVGNLVVCDCGTESFYAMRIDDDLELRCTECATLHRPLQEALDGGSAAAGATTGGAYGD